MSLFGPVPDSDLIFFTSQLATLYKSGVTIPSAISLLYEQTQNPALVKALGFMKNDLASGNTLADAMAKFPKIFNKLYVNSVWAGETTGALDEIMIKLAELLKTRFKLRREIFLALRYPVILMILIFAITIFNFSLLFIFIIGLLILLFLIIFIFYLITRNKKRKIYWDRFKLKIPVIGPLVFQLTMFRFAWLFEIINRTGIELTNSLRIVAKRLAMILFQPKLKRLFKTFCMAEN